ncbi:SGNH/GDSL hydrolase family protein [Gemmiger sp.]
MLDKIAPKDPTAKRPGFYVLLDKPVGGLPSNDGVGRHPVYINGDRLVTFAKMVGGIDDETILEMLRTAKGFRKLVHSVGVSIVGDLPDKVVTFTLGFSGELGSGGSRNSMKITTDGTEHVMVMDEQEWSDSDETPQEFLFELVKPKDIATATVKLYLNDGYTVPEVDPDPPVAFDTPAYSEMIARSCLSTGNNVRIKRVLQQLRDGKPTTIAFLGGSITQGAGAVPSQEMCYARKTYEAICETYTPDHGANVRYIKAGVGGTPCQLGIIRYDRDITRDGAVQPDLVIVEFAVNDEADETKGLMHESLIQKIWQAPNQPAVVMLFSVFANDWNLKDRLAPIGWRHELPMVNVLDAVSPQFRVGVGERSVITRRQYFYDVFHPSNSGHRIMRDCLMYMLDRLDKQQEGPAPKGSAPYYGFDFAETKLLDRSVNPFAAVIDPGSFTETDTDLQSVPFDFEDVNTPEFPHNWKKGAGDKPFTMDITCRSIQLVFKDSGSKEFGAAVVTVDGKEGATYDPRLAGWTHCHAAIILKEETVRKHHIEIAMKEQGTDKVFTILGFGVL